MGMRQTDERISQKADRLHLTFLRDHLPEVLESIMAANMTTREAFDFAFGKEIEQREINRFKQALQAAHFPCIKRLEDFDFSAQPSIDPGTIQELAKLEWIGTGENVAFFGAPGVGKTHLVNAIGAKIKELHPEKRVLYVSAHLFQVQYTDSVRKNTVNDFINFYQTIDVLIIDDVQEFASLTKTQNTFFHIFNHLHQNGKQLILTSDRPPTALQGMEERLLTRFKWGLLAEIEKPNQQLRHDILESKVRRDHLKMPEDVIDYVSENVNDSVRELEGVVNSLMAYSVVWNRDIDLPLAEQILKRAVKAENKPITIDLILDKVCGYFNVKQEEVFTKCRKQPVAQVRQIAMYLAQKHTNLSLARIGTLIGKRTHATVLHSCNVVEDRLHVDKNFKSKLN